MEETHRSGCPINLTLEVVGDRWSLIVIRDVMFGNRRHFRELLAQSEEKIASNILADRLRRLERAGAVAHQTSVTARCADGRLHDPPYSEGRRAVSTVGGGAGEGGLRSP